MTSITKSDDRIKFDRDGWPLAPITGQRFSRDEIVSNPAIPYPAHVDPAQPGPYWRRRTPAELAAEQQRASKKAQNRAKARQRSRGRSRRRTLASSLPLAPLSSVERQAEQRGRAIADQVTRANNGLEVAQ